MLPGFTLPPVRGAESDLEAIQALVMAGQRTVVVLDDDPTGTQTAHGVGVLTEWPVPTLAAELAAIILMNTREMASFALVQAIEQVAYCSRARQSAPFIRS